MKKLVTSLLIVVLLFNFIFCHSYCVFADSDGDEERKKSTLHNTSNVVASEAGRTEIIEEGAVSQKQGSSTKVTLDIMNVCASAVGFITGILSRIINILLLQVDILISSMTACDEVPDGAANTENFFWFTIDRAVFNRIPLFNINYFDTDTTYKVGNTELEANSSNLEIKTGITRVYYICRILALVLSLLVLIYIGIKMAISTVASDQAKYKKMLVSWIESVIILFITVYIISAVITFGEVLTGIFYNMRNNLINSGEGYGVFEDTIRGESFPALFGKAGLDLTLWSMIYWCLLYSEIKFFWLYAKRLLMVGLLIIISPLIIITYSIDKAGDGKAQVFSSWLKEFLINVLIQPLHALIYLVMVLTANTIAIEAPIVALAMLMSMGTVERMVKVIFDMKGLSTLRGVNKFMKK